MQKTSFLLITLLLALVVGSFAQGQLQKPGEIQKPKADWQKPGDIQKPKSDWQKPGEFQTPKGIEAIRKQSADCQQRLIIGADTLFEFDKWTLTADAEETLRALEPLIVAAGKHPLIVEGHTDSKGADAYNQMLSDKRAKVVKDWLASHGYTPATSVTKGYGETRPVAANANQDGSDNPEGRRLNRRVEIVIDSCR